jgi:predicted ATPase
MCVFVVISGPPGAGKTTLINLLRKMGYLVLDEMAEIVIKEGELLPWIREQLEPFQDSALSRQFQREEQFAAQRGVVFLDRGLFDIEGYSILGDIRNEHLFKHILGSRYVAMMLLEPLGFFERTDVRRDDPAVVQKLFDILEQTYIKHGVPVERIPPFLNDPEGRLKYLLECAGKYCHIDHPDKVRRALDVLEDYLPKLIVEEQEGEPVEPSWLGQQCKRVADFFVRWSQRRYERKIKYNCFARPPWEEMDSNRLWKYRLKACSLVARLPELHPAHPVLAALLERFEKLGGYEYNEMNHDVTVAFKKAFKAVLEAVMEPEEFREFTHDVHERTVPTAGRLRLYYSSKSLFFG